MTSMDSAARPRSTPRSRLRDLLRPIIATHLAGVPVDAEQVVSAAALLVRCYARRGKALIFGNGGSAACAQHLVAELVGRLLLDRGPLAAVSLTSDSAVITAIANDFGFEQVFARQVEALGQPGDVAIALSTSGRSPNVLLAAETARRLGLGTVGLLGDGDTPLRRLVDVAVCAQSSQSARIQETHLALQHALCAGVEAAHVQLALEDEPEAGTEPRRGTVLSWAQLTALRGGWRRAGREVVFVGGCFEVLHASDIDALVSAARSGDMLVVGIEEHEVPRRRLGADCPLTPAPLRAAAVAAIRAVDYAIVVDDPDVAIARLEPDVVLRRIDTEV
jgi:phosphoheptose isomerase/glycerol-3-phosphate cytidylyltransferase-like family protein